MIKKIAALVVFILGAATPVMADPYQDFSVVLKNVMAAHTYRMTIAEANGRTIVFDHVAPDRYHEHTPDSDTYIVGTQGVIVEGDRRTPIPSSVMTSARADMFAEMSKAGNVRDHYTISYVGMQGDQRMYTIVNHLMPGAQEKVWVGPNNLPTRSVTNGGGRRPPATVTYAFNLPISIQMP